MAKKGLHFMSTPSYNVDLRFSLYATGRWSQGGVIEVTFGTKPIKSLDLPPNEWGILAILMETGIRSAGQHWLHGFISAKELAVELKHKVHRGSGLASDANGNVYRLRKRLKDAFFNGISPTNSQLDDGTYGEPWYEQLIETHRAFGYRISLPPEQLALTSLP